MEVEYRKDLRCSYMVIAEENTVSSGRYSVDLLEHQTIEGILPFERRRLDNRVFYYYEITGKQAMNSIYEKAVLNFDALKDIFQGILEVLGKAYDYLLPEDDFILSPEFIYMNIVINRPNLCYLPGYAKSIKKQMSGLLEYLMNKVDYNDKDAVLLIYQLYAVSREEEFTLNQLENALHRDHQEEVMERTVRKRSERYFAEADKQTDPSRKIIDQEAEPSSEKATGAGKERLRINQEDSDEDDLPANIPVMKEKIESEAEVHVYPIWKLVLSGICILVGVLLVILGFATGILYNSFGNRIDYSKLLALILIILCAEGYILNKLLDKKNKVTKVVKTCEYVDPRKSTELQGVKRKRKPKLHIMDDLGAENDEVEERSEQSHTLLEECEGISSDKGSSVTDLKKQSKAYIEIKESCNEGCNERKKERLHGGFPESRHEILYENEDEEEVNNPTCLLNAPSSKKPELILKALNENQYEDIFLSTFPFFIGKLKKNVDYCLEKDVISKFHAKITIENERFFITDLNSTNGTFINGEALMTYQKKEIKAGDEIVFANIRYRLMEE